MIFPQVEPFAYRSGRDPRLAPSACSSAALCSSYMRCSTAEKCPRQSLTLHLPHSGLIDIYRCHDGGSIGHESQTPMKDEGSSLCPHGQLKRRVGRSPSQEKRRLILVSQERGQVRFRVTHFWIAHFLHRPSSKQKARSQEMGRNS